jgi:hypothetical protein
MWTASNDYEDLLQLEKLGDDPLAIQGGDIAASLVRRA